LIIPLGLSCLFPCLHKLGIHLKKKRKYQGKVKIKPLALALFRRWEEEANPKVKFHSAIHRFLCAFVRADNEKLKKGFYSVGNLEGWGTGEGTKGRERESSGK